MHCSTDNSDDRVGDTSREPRVDAAWVSFRRVLKKNHKQQRPQLFPGDFVRAERTADL